MPATQPRRPRPIDGKRLSRAAARPARTRGVTLVELLVSLAIFSIISAFLFTAFSTTTNSVEVGEARQDVVQNARVALGVIAQELHSAFSDDRRRDFVLVSADGLNGLPHARLQYNYTAAYPAGVPNPADATATAVRGLGNAQQPVGLDLTANGTTYGTYGQVYDLYRLPEGTQTNRIVSIKANEVSLPPGPPDRLDFVGFASSLAGFSVAPTTDFGEIRYLIAAATFNDGVDNDLDGATDAADSTLPAGTATWAGAGDVLVLNNLRAQDLGNIIQLGLYRAADPTPDNNPFSNQPLPRPGNIQNTTTVPAGRHPFRDFSELIVPANGELIGAFIYDLQFEFFGKIAIQLDDNGAPNRYGIGWGYQDVRGEDVGTDSDARVVDANGSQANGQLDAGEDTLGPDGVNNDPGDDGSGLPNNISDNDGVVAEDSLFENDGRLQSRVMGIWDSRAPDPRNPRSARELNGLDDDGDAAALQGDGIDNDGDGTADDTAAVVDGTPEGAGGFAELFDSTDNDADGTFDDRFYEAAGKPEGVDEPSEANPRDDSLPTGIRIWLTVRDRNQFLDPVVLHTTVWLGNTDLGPTGP